MKHQRGLAALATVLLLGCEGASDTSEPIAKADQQALIQGCVESREKAAECREVVVDDWIDIRAKYHPDIAAEMKTPQERAALRAVALEEFKNDGTGPRAERVKVCTDMLGRLPPPAIALGREFASCNPLGCAEWAKCVLPKFEKMNMLQTRGNEAKDHIVSDVDRPMRGTRR